MSAEPSERLPERVEAIRRFNRLYTRRIGLLQSRHLGTEYSLTEARILFELGQRPAMTAKDLCGILELDQGYVSRILARFEKRGLITRRASEDDGRIQHVALGKAGRKAFGMLNDKAHDAIAVLLKDKSERDQRTFTDAAQTLARLLGDATEAPVVIRAPKPGDLGWIIHRHGTVIAEEFGWNADFEIAVAEILSNVGHHPGREGGWVAERAGEILGSVFVMPDDAQTARLRVLYVEPAARGLGLGKQLVELAVGFARQAGYTKLVLWTHEFQISARKVYAAAGFRLAHREKTMSFGVDVVSETWEMDLKPQPVEERPRA